MNTLIHKIYIASMASIVIAISYYLSVTGYSYYTMPLEERFYHPKYDWFKPSGLFGQGLGVIGTLMIAFGVSIYIARKRYGFLDRYIRLKYLLEFHIFLCTLGPILVLFHTTFKFGGIVSIAFWSMVAVVLSGVIGRFIYIQIPRTIEGRELSIQEIHGKRTSFEERIRNQSDLDESTIDLLINEGANQQWGLKTFFNNLSKRRKIKRGLMNSRLDRSAQNEILQLAREEMALSSKVGRLPQMQKLFKLWHVVHMPFAIIMVIIVLIHVGVTIALGYRWIF